MTILYTCITDRSQCFQNGVKLPDLQLMFHGQWGAWQEVGGGAALLVSLTPFEGSQLHSVEPVQQLSANENCIT